jgi:N-sulfoglucosamine sulfohydrolase
MPVLAQTNPPGWDRVYFSHTFHEVIDYYPMRGVRTRRYKYIHNLFPGIEYQNATDLWASPTWQSIRAEGKKAMMGGRPVMKFLHRDREELYDLEHDPNEVNNLAESAEHREILEQLRRDTNDFRKKTGDVWMKNPLPSGEQPDRSFA